MAINKSFDGAHEMRSVISLKAGKVTFFYDAMTDTFGNSIILQYGIFRTAWFNCKKNMG